MAKSRNFSMEFYVSSLDSAYYFIIGFTNIIGIGISWFNINDLRSSLLIIFILTAFILGAFQQVKAVIKNSLNERMQAWRTLFLNIGVVCGGLPVWTSFGYIPWSSMNPLFAISAITFLSIIVTWIAIAAILIIRDRAYQWLTSTVKKIYPAAEIPKARDESITKGGYRFWIELAAIATIPAVAIFFGLITPYPYNLVIIIILMVVFVYVSIGNPITFSRRIRKSMHDRTS